MPRWHIVCVAVFTFPPSHRKQAKVLANSAIVSNEKVDESQRLHVPTQKINLAVRKGEEVCRLLYKPMFMTSICCFSWYYCGVTGLRGEKGSLSEFMLWFNTSWQLSPTLPLAHSPPPPPRHTHWDGGENLKGESEKTHGLR